VDGLGQRFADNQSKRMQLIRLPTGRRLAFRVRRSGCVAESFALAIASEGCRTVSIHVNACKCKHDADGKGLTSPRKLAAVGEQALPMLPLQG